MTIPNNIQFLRPPRAKDPTAPQAIPGTSNIWKQYEDLLAATKPKHQKPPYVQNVLSASREAMRSIRSVDGRKIPSQAVSEYNQMTMDDFDRMRQEKGIDGVANYVQKMEYERLGGNDGNPNS